MKFPMRRFIKVLAWVIVGLVGVVALALVGIYRVSGAKLKRTYHIVVQPEPVQATAAMITKGHHLAVSRGCADCHGVDMGGHMVIDSPPMGKIYAPNLTRGQGGVVANFKDEDWLRAIRHGVGPDGRALFLMPSKEYAHFSTDDMGALEEEEGEGAPNLNPPQPFRMRFPSCSLSVFSKKGEEEGKKAKQIGLREKQGKKARRFLSFQSFDLSNPLIQEFISNLLLHILSKSFEIEPAYFSFVKKTTQKNDFERLGHEIQN